MKLNGIYGFRSAGKVWQPLHDRILKVFHYTGDGAARFTRFSFRAMIFATDAKDINVLLLSHPSSSTSLATASDVAGMEEQVESGHWKNSRLVHAVN